MVYCTKCGTKNLDDAQVCSQCGASLYPVKEERERYRRRYEQECFGIPHGGIIVGLVIGIIIVLAGLIWILQQADVIPSSVSVWPFAVIIVGILLVIGALYRMRSKY